MATPVRFYYDLMSQPSRALYIFLKLSNIEFDDHQIQLRKGIHLTDEYKENVNRFKKVPAIVTANNFKLSESIAIFRYLAASNPIADNWYPKDLEERARIDEYFAWQHLNTRMTCMYFFILKYLKPRTTGKEIGDDEIVRSSQKQMEDVLNKIENLWLDDKPNTFIGGLNELSFADLLAACELEQPRVAGFEPGDGRPRIQNWLNLVKQKTNPHYDDAHKVLYQLSGQSPVDPFQSALKL